MIQITKIKQKSKFFFWHNYGHTRRKFNGERMIKSNSAIEKLNNSSVILDEYINENPSKSISNYIEKVKSADIEQVKIYLGFVYFAALLFFSFSLFF